MKNTDLSNLLINSIRNHYCFRYHDKEYIVKFVLLPFIRLFFDSANEDARLRKENPHFVNMRITYLADLWDFFIKNLLSNKTDRSSGIENIKVDEFMAMLIRYEKVFELLELQENGGLVLNSNSKKRKYSFRIDEDTRNYEKMIFTRSIPFLKPYADDSERFFIPKEYLEISKANEVYWILRSLFEYSDDFIESALSCISTEPAIILDLSKTIVSKNDFVNTILYKLSRNGMGEVSEDMVRRVISCLGYDLNDTHRFVDIHPKTKPLIFSGDKIIIPVTLFPFIRFQRSFFHFLSKEFFEEIFNQPDFQYKFQIEPTLRVEHLLKKFPDQFLFVREKNITVLNESSGEQEKTDIDLLIYHIPTKSLLSFESKNFITPDTGYDERKIEFLQGSAFSTAMNQIAITERFLKKNGNDLSGVFGERVTVEEINCFILSGSNYIGISHNYPVVSVDYFEYLIEEFQSNLSELFGNPKILIDYKRYCESSPIDPENKQFNDIKIPLFDKHGFEMKGQELGIKAPIYIGKEKVS